MATSGPGAHPSGIAPVKAEFRVAVRPPPVAASTADAASSGTAPNKESACTHNTVEPIGNEATAGACSSLSATSTAATADDAAEEGTNQGTDSSQPSRKRQRGMNKQRKHYRPDDSGEVKMCTKIMCGEECKFGQECKFSHDLAAAFARRPADLGEECPIWTLRGHCRFGVHCRFGSCHLEAPSGQSVRRTVAEPPYEELNVVDWSVAHLLRRRQVDFAASDELADAFQAEVSS